MKFFAGLSFILMVQNVMAFPEMIRHHYVNCSACHVSTTGGGLLNAYGRTISTELLSSSGNEKEGRAFYSINPEKIPWLNIGGDLRSVQTHMENSQVSRGRYIWMEANVQAAVTLNKITAFLSVGEVEQTNQSFKADPIRYYLSYQHSDELSIRAGRYLPIYGINLPQHTFLIKQNLQLGPGTDRYAADVQWNGENYNFLFGISQSLLDSAVRDEEFAYNAQVQKNINDNHKVGLSSWYGEAVNYRKIQLGAHAVSGWSEHIYSLFEVDHQWSKDNNDFETKSIFQLLKLGYEITKGLHFQLVEEYGKIEAAAPAEIQSFGAGAIWYPRPHFEVEALYSKRQTRSTNDSLDDFAYLLLHFYF